MNSTLLLETVDELEKILNSHFVTGCGFKPYTIRISKNNISLFLITEVLTDSENKQTISCKVLLNQEVNKSFFAEFAQFLKNISAIFGIKKEIQNILNKFSKNAELSDVLESI